MEGSEGEGRRRECEKLRVGVGDTSLLAKNEGKEIDSGHVRW